MKLNIRHSSPLPLLERKHAWFIVDVLLRRKSWLIPLGRVPLLSHWSKTLSWYEHKLLHAPSPSMSVHACESVCVGASVPPSCVCVCVCVWACEKRLGCCIMWVCAHMHPPSPEAVLCIVVGMAYMLSQACFIVVQCTRLPIRAALPCRVRRPLHLPLLLN